MKSLARQLLLLIVLLSGLVLWQSAQAQPQADPTKWTYEVKKAGDNKYQLIFHCVFTDKSWHVYSMNPGGDGMLIPPKFSFTASSDYKKLGKMKEQGKKITKFEEVLGGNMYYYENKVDFIQDVQVTKNTVIKGSHSYQVCQESGVCLQEKTLKFSFEITDATAMATPGDSLNVAGADTVQTTAGDTIAGGPGADTVVTTTTSGPAGGNPGDRIPGTKQDVLVTKGTGAHASMSPLLLFFTGFGNGLVSVITPCVFAMLPMTVSFFLKRSKDRKTGIRIALQYALNIVLIFTIIGGVLSLIFGPDALHAFSTNWIVNLLFFAVFLIFGISFLGAFEINLPSSWATKLDSKANTSSFIGIFFMALTLVVVSFSCTGAFIGNLLGAMAQGGKMGPLTGFFGYGVGLALPFALFAIFPGMLNELGKSGGWLNAVKVVFGFVELGLAMKFLSNADLDRGWRLLDREVFVAIWVVLALVMGLYLLGMIRFSHDSDLPKNDWGLPYLKVPRLLLALSAIIFSIYLLPGMWGAPLNAMGAFVPPMGTYTAFGTGGSAPGSEQAVRKYAGKMKLYESSAVISAGLEVFFDYDQALEESKRTHKPVLLDFTGIQCVNCRKFESEVWSDPEVNKRMKNDFIIASLYTDAHNVPLEGEAKRYSKAAGKDVENLGDKNVDLQLTKFNSNTQPYYFFVDAQGRQLADKGVSYPTAPSDFVAHLDGVKAKYRELNP